MEVLVVLGIVGLLSLISAGGVYVVQTQVARRTIVQDEQLAQREATTNVCMACEGSGSRWEALLAPIIHAAVDADD
jgi:type II secretory pathway pseudopilin PulG